MSLKAFHIVFIVLSTALAIGFAMLLMSALMGLVFLSSGTGHDEAIANPLEDDADDDDDEKERPDS